MPHPAYRPSFFYLNNTWPVQYSNNQAREGTQNQHKTRQVQQACFHKPKNLSLVTDVKKINFSLRMVKNWPKHVGEFLGLLKQYIYFNVLFLIK